MPNTELQSDSAGPQPPHVGILYSAFDLAFALNVQAIVFIDRKRIFALTGTYIAFKRQDRALQAKARPKQINPKNKHKGKHNAHHKTLAGIALGCCLISNAAQAASIQSLTIEEIGVASGGLGSSGASGGGWGNYFSTPNTFGTPPAFFTSDGIDGAIIMGTTQANGAISTGFTWGGNHFEFNTLNGAPSGSITDGIMSLDLSGLVAEYTFGYTAFPAGPDAGTLVTSVSMIDASHYFYTADWTHVFNDDVYDLNTLAIVPGWNGSGAVLHFEGIATLAPVPEAETYAMMLAGLGLVGLMAHRRRKLI